jgi:lipopolysaccharide export LptBFGC system permease protein LptF
MRILDKYIIGKFLTAFFFTVLMLVSVICVIDYTEKNDDFLHANLSFFYTFTHYYIYLFPYHGLYCLLFARAALVPLRKQGVDEDAG